MPKTPTDSEIIRADKLQSTFSKDVKMIDGKLIHTKDGGEVEEYPQNPPHHKYLYGCIICGSYFETDVRQL